MALKAFTKTYSRKGIYFQSLFVEFDRIMYYPDEDNSKLNRRFNFIEKWMPSLNKLICPWYERSKKSFTDGECDGYYVRTVRFPITFKRTYRELEGYDTDANFKIHSIGYEDNYNECSGKCVREVTNIKIDHKKYKISTNGSFKYTYSHKIEETFYRNIDGIVKFKNAINVSEL